MPLLLPAGGFFNWSKGAAVAKPPGGGLDTPNVRPAEGLMPGLLKLKPELLVLPKPSKARQGTKNKKTVKYEKNKKIKHE